MSMPVTVRLPEPSAEELRRIARKERRSVSEVGARLIEEGLRQARFPHIEFRSFAGERHACIKGRLQVWQLVMVARDYAMDVEKVARHLEMKPEQVRAALSYYEAYPEEIDRALADNDAITFERLKQFLPNAQVADIPRQATEREP